MKTASTHKDGGKPQGNVKTIHKGSVYVKLIPILFIKLASQNRELLVSMIKDSVTILNPHQSKQLLLQQHCSGENPHLIKGKALLNKSGENPVMSKQASVQSIRRCPIWHVSSAEYKQGLPLAPSHMFMYFTQTHLHANNNNNNKTFSTHLFSRKVLPLM